ncbi:MAG: hypothetical protein ABJF04_24610 [Reichenbachiella sp.]|uniref:hypothetical protein n=1 Tax=Reichenbachiella sp. TaxID=2184521 RepID=UPI0032669713
MPQKLFDFQNRNINQTGYAILFGVSSMLLGFVQFSVPGVEGVSSDFREVPLLISLFYLKHPIFIAIECIITTANIPPDASYIGSFAMHFFPLWLGLFFYNQVLSNRTTTHWKLTLLWILFTTAYYYLLIIPIMMLINELFELTQGMDFLNNYWSVIFSIRFETLSTILITSIFLVQLKTRQSLQEHEKNLVVTINDKTKALADANAELKIMNENLDQLVKERTQKVHDQFDQLLKYAHHNSHEVRAPLSRMQGLMSIIMREKDNQVKMDLIEKLKISSEELDAVIIEMNQILESEILKEKK